LENLIALAVATAVLVAIPGPNVALTVANSLRFGFAAGAVTVAGAVVGVGLQLALVVSGLAALVDVAGSALTWIKWLGVAYLLLLGVLTWRTPAGDLSVVQARPMLFRNALLIAVINPKTLVFNAAFLPQFVTAPAGFTQLAAAAAVMLAVIFVGDLSWALFASRASLVLRRYSAAWNRVTGVCLLAAGLGLAFARR